ncbi:MAG: hypothetical protein ACP5QK_06065 [Myxococcota bacterium]
MRYSLFVLMILILISCESEKIPYHCGVITEIDGSIRDVLSDTLNAGDNLYFDGSKFLESVNIMDAGEDDSDAISRDVTGGDAGRGDIVQGKPCTNIGVSEECASDESCYPFVECGGVCRKCGSSTVGSNCEIHSDCKCGMVCLSLIDKTLKCYKVCRSNIDCPSGQSCTDGWGIEYEHEYFKICKGLSSNTVEGR